MPLYSKTEKGDGQVVVWHITESVEELLLRIDLSDEDAKRLSTFRLDKRKKEWLASRILLQCIIGCYPNIEYDKNGKPNLKGSKLCISISHTNGFAAVCVSNKPTAVDIEICSQRVEKVADRFVHPSEEAYVDDGVRTVYYTVLWSAKEALYKYYNVFGVIFKEQFIVHPFAIEKQNELSCEFHQEDVIQELKLHYEVNDKYTLVYNL